MAVHGNAMHFIRILFVVLLPISLEAFVTTGIPKKAFTSVALGSKQDFRPKYAAGAPRIARRRHAAEDTLSTVDRCERDWKDKSESMHGEETGPDSISRRRLVFSLLASTATTSTLLNGVEQAEASETTLNSPASETSFERPGFTGIIVPPMDNRSYESFALPNGLEVILCSDPASNAAAAAMNVHVGASSDPESIPGLAHFNEHMLFLGTEKYPEEDSFETFLSTNGGSSNAFTDSENTCYYFDMTADNDKRLGEGLDRFSSFFTSPLFTEAATGRELNAIESENTKNLQSDIFRIYQIEKGRANKDHPYHKFYTGNKSTLLDNTRKNNIDLRSELIKFWSTYYSARQMSLAIVAPQSISELKEMVQSTFSSIPNNPERAGIPPEESWAGISPFVPGTSIIPGQKNIVEIVPVADLRQVTLTWPINFHSKEEKKIHLATKPDFYVSHLVGHEGPNSLLSYLKKQGWANGVGASNDADMSDFYTFEVTVSLTTKGLNAVDNVIESVLSYIKMLRDDPIPQYIFQEVLQLSELDWRFLTKGGPTSYVQSLVKSMKEYPESLYVAGPRRLALEESDSKLLSNNKPRSGFTSDEQLEKTIRTTSTLVSKLTIDDALITVLSKTFSGKTKRKEKWYGTDYNVKPIPIKNLNQWKNCAKATNIGMAYPPPNVFIPSESGLRVKKPVKINDKPQKLLSIEERLKPISPPKVIRDDGEEGRWTVHFKQDDTFGQPKSFAIFQLLTKEVFKNPMSASLAQLYQVSANDKLKEYAYDAGLAGLSYDIQVLPRGVRLSFGGYSEKLLDFATYVTEKLSQDVSSLLPEDEDDFDRYKDEIVRALAGFDVQQPYAHAIYYSSLVFQPKSFLFTNAELRDSIKKATRGDLTEYAKGLWASGKAEGLLQGNIDQPEALQFVEVIDKTLSFGTIKPSEIPPRFKPLSLPVTEGNSPPVKISISEPNSSNKNAAAQVTYQCLDTSEKSHIVIDIISSILSERFYEDLRTKQQLGYIVSCGVKAVSDTRNLSFIVQSSVAPTDKLTKEIFTFIDGAKSKYIDTLNGGDIDQYAKGIFLKLTEPDKKLATEASRNWSEIATGKLEFSRRQKAAQAVLEVEKDDIVQYWDKYILGANGGKRVLVTEDIPKSGAASSKILVQDKKQNPYDLRIEDLDTFRKDREASSNE